MVQALPPPRPVENDDRDEILVPVASGLQELIFGSPGLFIDRPGFVAGPTPDTGLAQAVQGLTRFNCRRWAASDKSNFSQAVNQGNADLCNPYLDGLGERPEGGGIDIPFEGGQCPVLYNLIGSATQADAGCNTISFPFDINGVPGPISLAYVVNEGGVGNPNPLCPGFAYRRVDFIDGNGNRSPLVGAGSGIRLDGFSVVRSDGQPDNCGNPPPVIQPPGTVTPVTPIPPTININLPGVGPVDVTLTLNPDGEPVVCIPEIDVCVTVQPPGGGGGGDGPTAPPGPGEPGEPEDTGPGGNADGEADEGEELVGVLVEILSAPEDANRFANNPAQPFRGIGYVRMGFPGRLGADISAGTVIGPQFFHAQQRGLTAWEVRANTGFSLRATPYYRSPE